MDFALFDLGRQQLYFFFFFHCRFKLKYKVLKSWDIVYRSNSWIYNPYQQY